MPYTTYSIEDFLADESFQAFVVEREPAAVEFWQQWIVEHPAKETEFYEAEAVLRLLLTQRKPVPGRLKREEVAKLWQTLQPAPPVQPMLRGQRRRRQRTAALVTAVVLLLAGIGWWLRPAPVAQWAIYTTHADEHRQVTLPDGSRVMLNANSVLKLANGWQPGTLREVWLSGEGYFDVQHTAPAQLKAVAAAPANVKFVVHASKADVAVLGTQFNVRSEAGSTKVVLRSGQIQLSRRQAGRLQQVLMQPGELVEISDSQPRQLAKRPVKADFYSAWTDGQLDFKDTPVADIVALLEDGYGLRVQVSNPALLRQKLTGSVPNHNLDILLNSLGKSLDVKVRREGQQVWLD